MGDSWGTGRPDYTGRQKVVDQIDNLVVGKVTTSGQRIRMEGRLLGDGTFLPVAVNSSGVLLTDIEVVVSSGLTIHISGAEVQTTVSGNIVSVVPSGTTWGAALSGANIQAIIDSGRVAVLSGEVHILSGEVTVGGTVATSVSGNIVSVVNTILSGTNLQTQILSGQIHILSGEVTVGGTASVVPSGTTWGAALSGANIQAIIDSGRVAVLSGEVHILSGEVTTSMSGNVVKAEAKGAKTLRIGSLLVATAASGGNVLCSGACHAVIVKNLSGNADIFVGGSGTALQPYSGFGMLLAAEEAITLDVDAMDVVHICANTSGNFVSYLAVDY